MTDLIPKKRIIPEIEEAKRVKKRYLIYTAISIGILTVGKMVPSFRQNFDNYRNQRVKVRQEKLITVGLTDKGDNKHILAIENELQTQLQSNKRLDLKPKSQEQKDLIEAAYYQKFKDENPSKSLSKDPSQTFVIKNLNNIFNPTAPFHHAIEEDHSIEYRNHKKHRFVENRLPTSYLVLLEESVRKLGELEVKIERLESSQEEVGQKQVEVQELKSYLNELHQSDKYQRINHILPLIVKDGYEPDDIEGNLNKLLDFILKSLEFVTESTTNLLKDELVLEVILIYSVFLLDLCTFSKLHLNHNLFGLLIDKAKLTSGFISTLSQATIFLENRGLEIRARVEAAKFNPEVEKGTVLKTLLSDKKWIDKIEILKAYYQTQPFEISKILTESLLELEYLANNLAPSPSEKVEYKQTQVVEGIFEEIRTVRNWILYYKMFLQLPILTTMSGSFKYALWDNFVDVIGRDDGFFISGNRDFRPLDEDLMPEFGYMVDHESKSFKEKLSKFNKVLAKIENTAKHLKNKLGFKDGWTPAISLLQSLEANSPNSQSPHIYKTIGYAPLDQEAIKSHLQTIFIASSGQFFGVEMAEGLADDFNRIVRICEIYGIEFFIKSYVFYVTIQELVNKETVQQEQIEYKVTDKNKSFSGLLGFGVENVNITKEIIPSIKYREIYQLFLEPINQVLNSLAEQIQKIKSFCELSEVQGTIDLTETIKQDLSKLSIDINPGDILKKPLEAQEELIDKVEWIKLRLKNIEEKSSSEIGSDKSEAINELFWFQYQLTEHYLGKDKIGEIHPILITQEERIQIALLKTKLAKHSDELTELWETTINRGNSLDIDEWISQVDTAIEDVKQYAPNMLHNENEEDYEKFDHDLINEGELSPIQKILRARSYFAAYRNGSDLNGLKYKDESEYRNSRVKRRLLSVVASLNGLAEQAEKKQIERLLEIPKRLQVYAEDRDINIETEYQLTSTHLLNPRENSIEINSFDDLNIYSLKDENGEILPFFDEFSKLGISPHLFKTGGIYDYTGLSRKAGVIKQGGQWVTNSKFCTKLLGEKHFKALLDPGFINFIVHIAPYQEIDNWIGGIRQERYTYFEKLMQFMDTPEFQIIYDDANQSPNRAKKPVSTKIQKFLNELFSYDTQKKKIFKPDQPQPTL